jgi:hypothetical protein
MTAKPESQMFSLTIRGRELLAAAISKFQTNAPMWGRSSGIPSDFQVDEVTHLVVDRLEAQSTELFQITITTYRPDRPRTTGFPREASRPQDHRDKSHRPGVPRSKRYGRL